MKIWTWTAVIVHAPFSNMFLKSRVSASRLGGPRRRNRFSYTDNRVCGWQRQRAHATKKNKMRLFNRSCHAVAFRSCVRIIIHSPFVFSQSYCKIFLFLNGCLHLARKFLNLFFQNFFKNITADWKRKKCNEVKAAITRDSIYRLRV